MKHFGISISNPQLDTTSTEDTGPMNIDKESLICGRTNDTEPLQK